jgi:hypothetical protein
MLFLFGFEKKKAFFDLFSTKTRNKRSEISDKELNIYFCSRLLLQ